MNPSIPILTVMTAYFLFGCVGNQYRKEKPQERINAYTKQQALEDTKVPPENPGEVKTYLPESFEKNFIVPHSAKDQYRNPVFTRNGSRFDQKTGYPYEIWMKKPRIEFVFIPAGEFMMGSPNSEAERRDNEGPIHRVHFANPFYLARYEVTQEQWKAVMGRNPSDFKYAGKNPPGEQITWDDCNTFCEKMGLLLPTEAQWEYACRSGTRTRNNLGDADADLGRAGWHCRNSGFKTHPVGKKAPNAWGLYDMHGNVREWCKDNWHGNYQGAPTDGGAWLGGSSYRVFRGGSWGCVARFCRSANRDWNHPSYHSRALGFRPVKLISRP